MAKRKTKRKAKRITKSSTLTPQTIRKLKFIDKRLSEFGKTFGYFSIEYRAMEAMVYSNLGGISPKTFKSVNPLQITETVMEIASKMGEFSPDVIDAIHSSFKGKTIFKKIKEKYGAEILREYNENKKEENKQNEFNSKFLKQNMELVNQYVFAKSLMAEVRNATSYLPNFYTALDHMDSFSRVSYRKKFSILGQERDKETRKRIAEELANDIYNYFDNRIKLNAKIINGENFTDEEPDGENIIDRNIMNEPLTIDWQAISKNLKK